jgi:hypothetical protein
MQVRQSSFTGDRPPCPVDSTHTVHRHDHYERFDNCNDDTLVTIGRFLCVVCLRTLSVLPDDMLPYRAVPAPLLEQDFDARSGQGAAPLVTENEKGCLKRAWHRFVQRGITFVSLLGQMMQFANREAKPIWNQLRRWGNLATILLRLGRPFNTSLLHDYRCLVPWTARPPD